MAPIELEVLTGRGSRYRSVREQSDAENETQHCGLSKAKEAHTMENNGHFDWEKVICGNNRQVGTPT